MLVYLICRRLEDYPSTIPNVMIIIWRFPKMGVPPVIIHFSGIFLINQQFWGTSISGKKHIVFISMIRIPGNPMNQPGLNGMRERFERCSGALCLDELLHTHRACNCANNLKSSQSPIIFINIL